LLIAIEYKIIRKRAIIEPMLLPTHGDGMLMRPSLRKTSPKPNAKALPMPPIKPNNFCLVPPLAGSLDGIVCNDNITIPTKTINIPIKFHIPNVSPRTNHANPSANKGEHERIEDALEGPRHPIDVKRKILPRNDVNIPAIANQIKPVTFIDGKRFK